MTPISSVSKGVILENRISDAFEEQGYIVFTRKNHVDVFAVKHNRHAYLVECKNYRLGHKQQMKARRQLTRNHTRALELLQDNRLHVPPERILSILVAQGFSYQIRDVFQYTPQDFLDHIAQRYPKTNPLGENPENSVSDIGVCIGELVGGVQGIPMEVM